MRQLRELEGKYEILRKLREGGMGAVYLVRHQLLDELRVVKVMREQFEADSEMRQRFLREARSAIRLRHPNIAQLYDFSVDDEGTGYIVMEFIDGVTFEQLVARRPLPGVALTLELATQALRALSFLHRKGFVHRDIAPDNLMLTRDPEGEPLVKLLDLGIAKAMTGDGRLTMSGSFLGKLRYASPEAFQPGAGGEGVGPHSDLYSFGIVLYELLTGAHPVAGRDTQAVIAGHLLLPPVPFEQSDPAGRVPPRLRSAVCRALAKRPGERFATADQFARELVQVESQLESLPETGSGHELEVGRILDGPDRTAAPTAHPAAGSTQERLDRQFSPRTTPAPRSVLLPTPPPGPTAATARAPRSTASDAETCRTVAEKTASVGRRSRPAAARERFAGEPGITDATTRVATHVRRLTAEREEEARREQERRKSFELVAEAERLEREQRFDDAAARLDEAAVLTPGDPALESVMRRVAALRCEATQKAQRARELVEALAGAESYADAGDWPAVQEELERILPALDLGGPDTAPRLRRLNARRERAARAARLAEAHRLVALGDLEEAAALLREGLAETSSWDEARALLDEVTEAAAERRWRAEERAAAERHAAEQEAEAIAAGLTELQRFLADGRVEAAIAAFDDLQSRHAGRPPFERERPALAAALATAREEGFNRLLIEMVALSDDGRFDAAIERAEAAGRLAQDSAATGQLQREVARLREQRDAARRPQA